VFASQWSASSHLSSCLYGCSSLRTGKQVSIKLDIGEFYKKWLRHHHTADELFLHNIVWTDKHILCPSVQRPQQSPLGIVSQYQRLSWNCECHLLPHRLTAQYCDYLETVLLELPEDVPLAVGQRFWFQHSRAPVHCGEDVQEGGFDVDGFLGYQISLQ
jgi:hypothetical protein